MSKAATLKRGDSLQEQYHHGQMSADEFLDKLLNSKEGDRKRRNAEERYSKLGKSFFKGLRRESK